MTDREHWSRIIDKLTDLCGELHGQGIDPAGNSVAGFIDEIEREHLSVNLARNGFNPRLLGARAIYKTGNEYMQGTLAGYHNKFAVIVKDGRPFLEPDHKVNIIIDPVVDAQAKTEKDEIKHGQPKMIGAVARSLDINRRELRQMIKDGDFPKSDTMCGDVPAWSASVIEGWLNPARKTNSRSHYAVSA